MSGNRLVIMGPPGAGKGTQAEFLCRDMNLKHLAPGDMLRKHIAEGTALGAQAKDIMARGELVPDELVVGLIREELSALGAGEGFLLDGFPRNVTQAQALDALLAELNLGLDKVLHLDTDLELIVSRLSDRRTCVKCQRVFNLKTKPHAEDGVCAEKGPCELTQRPDDVPEAVRSRLKVYEEKTAPVLAYYEKTGLLRTVDGAGDVMATAASLKEAVCEA